ncbi:hypothetical protein [Pasteuria penetrans]|uniref:hypothetical protein n=1 Tax=Pasteuria penetrans TaxID=86005 RepID=UPI00165AF98F|nr:hypothetical protein [Pasteuria penetrans]
MFWRHAVYRWNELNPGFSVQLGNLLSCRCLAADRARPVKAKRYRGALHIQGQIGSW